MSARIKLDSYSTAFYPNGARISFRAIIALLLGQEIEAGNYRIGLYHMPDTGCPCEGCKARFPGRPAS